VSLQKLEKFPGRKAGLPEYGRERATFDRGVLRDHYNVSGRASVYDMTALDPHLPETGSQQGIVHLAKREISERRAHAASPT
jgi:hypothetical protein